MGLRLFLSSVFSEIAKRFDLLFVGAKFVVPEQLKRQIVDALHLGHEDASGKQQNWWPGMKKKVGNNCSPCTACMSSGENWKYQWQSTEKIKLPVLTECGQEIQMDLSGERHFNHVTG